MHIAIEWHGNQFNVILSTKPDADPFLQIKGCRIAETKSGGRFISYPARKNEETGKWWNHVWGSDKFNDAVMKAAEEAMPQEKPRKSSDAMDGLKDDLPF